MMFSTNSKSIKHLGFGSWCHWGAKVIQVPDIDFRLIPTWCNQVCLEQRKKIRNCFIHSEFMHNMKHEEKGPYLKGVDVQSSHWSRVPVTLSNDHVTPSSHDLCRVVKDDIAVLASCDEDSRWVTAVIHSMWTPDQFVVSVGRSWVMSSGTEDTKSTGCCQCLLFHTCGRRRSCHKTSFPDMVP